MNALAEWVLGALLAFHAAAASTGGETTDARLRRLEGLATGLAEAVDLAAMTGRIPVAERRLWAAAAVATALRESGLALAVHAGQRLGDGGKSICLFQIHRGNPHPAYPWESLAGISPAATRRCAQAGVWSLARMRAHCARRVPRGRLLASALSGYMHGSSCEVSAEGARRAALTRSIERAEERRQARRDR